MVAAVFFFSLFMSDIPQFTEMAIDQPVGTIELPIYPALGVICRAGDLRGRRFWGEALQMQCCFLQSGRQSAQ